MATQAPTTDIRVKIGRRFANLSFHSEGGMQIQYPSADPIHLHKSDLKNSILGPSTAAVCLASPRIVAPGTKRPVPSIVFSTTTKDAFDTLADGLLRLGSVDARHAPHMSTVCERTSVQILPGIAVVVWTPSGCTFCPAEHVVLQRTKGGMSTYDVHILHKGCDTVTTVDMLPHSTMAYWADAMGESNVFDAGADPISKRLIQGLYDPEDGWALDDAFSYTSSEEEGDLSSNYATGEEDMVESSESSDEESEEDSEIEQDSESEDSC